MKLGFGGQVLGILAGLTLAGGMLHADPVVGSGTFNLAGAVYVSTTAIEFGFDSVPPPGDQSAHVVLPTTGQFSDLTAGETAGVKNLYLPTNVPAGVVTPGTPFLLPDWITLGDGINLDLTNIPINTDVPVCDGSSAENTPGFECRAYASSPIVLSQTVTGVDAKLNLTGMAHYAGSSVDTPFTALLSANFTFSPDSTISGLLADFNTHGFITTGYSANFTTNPVPEPAALAPLGLGLLGMGIFRRKKAVKA